MSREPRAASSAHCGGVAQRRVKRRGGWTNSRVCPTDGAAQYTRRHVCRGSRPPCDGLDTFGGDVVLALLVLTGNIRDAEVGVGHLLRTNFRVFNESGVAAQRTSTES